jgi:glycerophosphoryl diester phosphodiesterase
MLACLDIALTEDDELVLRHKHTVLTDCIAYGEAVRRLVFDRLHEEWSYQVETKMTGTLKASKV